MCSSSAANLHKNVMLAFHEVRLYELLAEWEGNLLLKVEVISSKRGFNFEDTPEFSPDNDELSVFNSTA